MIFLAILAAIPFVIGSLFICAPKWWQTTVVPRIPESLRGGTPLVEVLTAERRGPSFWRWLAAPIVLPFTLFAIYVSAVGVLIERGCPYTTGDKEARDLRKVTDDFLAYVRAMFGVRDWAA